jgi:hypothetical protein
MHNLLSYSSLSQSTNIKVYKPIILPVLYECKTWSLTFREECRLRVFDNRVREEYLGLRGMK